MKKYKNYPSNFALLTFLSLFLTSFIFGQTIRNDLLSLDNRKDFGNYLFCQKDYLRAIDEFNIVLNGKWNDTLQYKVASSYFNMKKYSDAMNNYEKLFSSKLISEEAKLEYYRSLFFIEDFEKFRKKFVADYFPKSYEVQLNRLRAYSYLMDDSELPTETELISKFGKPDVKQISEFYNWKKEPPYKSPTKAAIMSSIIPGLGKVYVDEVGDGITAFLLTGLFTYLAMDKFQKDQTTSAWLYTALAAFFYGGNIYGSASAVQNYNASIKFTFDSEVKVYINKRDHFLPKPKYMCE